MNNTAKVLLGIAVAIILYYALHLLVALFSLLATVVVIAIAVHCYKMLCTELEKPGQAKNKG